MSRLHIIDGHAYIFRGYYAAHSNLSTNAGMPTGALYLYTKMLWQIYKDENPEYVVVVFDGPGKTFRHELDPDYKANRGEMPDDLKKQMPYFAPVTEGFGWHVLTADNVEADDIIATLCRRSCAAGFDVSIYSSDKDLMQLVDDKVQLIDSKSKTVYLPETVEKKFGVFPCQLHDWLTLVGDSSDNIPGLAGVGAKTATKLLKEYRDIDDIIANSDIAQTKFVNKANNEAKKNEVNSSDLEVYVQTHVEEQKKRLLLSYKLVSLLDDLSLTSSKEQWICDKLDNASLVELFETLEFGKLSNEILGQSTQPDIVTSQSFCVVVGHMTLANEWIAAIQTDKKFSFYIDAEKNNHVFDIKGIAVYSLSKGSAYFSSESMNIVSVFETVFCDETIVKTCYDIKHAYAALLSQGIVIKGLFCDVMLAAYLIDSTRKDYSLQKLYFLACTSDKSTQPTTMLSYVQAIYQMGEQTTDVIKKRDIYQMACDVEYPLAELLSRIEHKGIALDRFVLKQLSEELEGRLSHAIDFVNTLNESPINLDSSKQIGVFLFEKLGLISPVMKKRKTGYSTDFSVLDAMRDQHEIVDVILEYRTLNKLKNTYLDVLPKLIDPKTQRIHTSFHQTSTATGRLSSSHPNLQNIPIRSELGKKIRSAFIAPQGRTLISCDYSQIELRLLAHFSKDETLCDAFHHNEDVHDQTACQIFDVKSPEAYQRHVAKAVNYGLVYGQTDFGLSRVLGVNRQEADHYITTYFNRFPKVAPYLDNLVCFAKEMGYAKTILNRRRYIPDLSANNYIRRNAAERIAKNTPLQGSAADIMKIAMVIVAKRLQEEHLDAAIVLTVHDELVLECATDVADETLTVVKDSMEHAIVLDVPLSVHSGKAQNWVDAH